MNLNLRRGDIIAITCFGQEDKYLLGYLDTGTYLFSMEDGNRWKDTPIGSPRQYSHSIAEVDRYIREDACIESWEVIRHFQNNVDAINDEIDNLYGQAIASKPVVKKPDIVEVYRFIRPRDEYGDIIATQGATLYAVLNYEQRTITFSWSICNGENFSKLMGRQVAMQRFEESKVGIIEMPKDGIPEIGLVAFLIDVLRDNIKEAPEEVVPQIKRILNFYFNS